MVKRLALTLAATALGLAVTAGCARSAGPAEVSAAAAPSTASTALPGASTTTASSSTTSPDSTSSSTSQPTADTSTTVSDNPVTAAASAITQALLADGHIQAYATCIVSTAATQFTGNEAKFVAGALALGHPNDPAPAAALQQIPLTDQEKADVPGHLQALYDTCASTEHPQPST